MADEYLVKGDSIKGIADTIRTKTSTTASLSFPDDFKTAISGIQVQKPEQTKNAMASPDGEVIVVPDSGKVLSKVIVSQIPYASGGISITINENEAKAYIDVNLSQSGYISDGNVEDFTKTIGAFPGKSITPGTDDSSIPNDTYIYNIGENGLTIKGDKNLISGNIKSGISIFGVAGTYDGDMTAATFETVEETSGSTWSINVIAKTDGRVSTGDVVGEIPQAKLSYEYSEGHGCDIHVDETGSCFAGDNPLTVPFYGGDLSFEDLQDNNTSILVDAYSDGNEGYVPPDTSYLIGTGEIKKSALVALESDCKASNIKSGATILGVAGTIADTTTTSAPTAAQVLSGKECWANNEKITGTMATITHAAPLITINSSGLITSRHTSGTGYIVGNTTSATKQLPTQAATTITPGTTNKTAVSSGRYTTGAVTIKGDANLVAANIKSGVSIFGVTGTYEGSGSSGNTWYQHTVKFTASADTSSDQNQAWNLSDGQIVFISKSSAAIQYWDDLAHEIYDAGGTSQATGIPCGGYASPSYGSYATGWIMSAYGSNNSNISFYYRTFSSSTGLPSGYSTFDIYDADDEYTTIVSDTVKALGVVSPTLTTTTDSTTGKVTLTITDNL